MICNLLYEADDEPLPEASGYKTMIEEMFARGFKKVLAGAFEENLASIRIKMEYFLTYLDKLEERGNRDS